MIELLTAIEVLAILRKQISNMEAQLNHPVRYKGTVASADLLPLNPAVGDMYNIESKSIYGEAGMNVAWNGVTWDTMGAPIDMSLYIKSNELADWVKQQNKPTYTAEEVGALPADTKIPTKVSELENDKKYLTEQAQSDWNQIDDTRPDFVKNKPTKLPASDVYGWAKQPQKPDYTANEVGALPDTTVIPSKTSELKNDSGFLSGTDKTLNVSGKAADAETVGTKISVLNDIICGTPHTDIVEEYLNRQRTGVVYQSKEWKSAVNPTTVIEKLGANKLIAYEPSTDTVEGADGYANRPEFQWWYGNYIRHDNEDFELTAIEGEDGYSETGTVDVCSFGPMFYYRKEDKGDYFLWSWSDTPHEELGLKPFQKNADGSVPAYWLLAAFPSVAGSDGLPRSQPNGKILRNQSYTNIHTNYQKKGLGYHGCGKERQTFLMIFNAIKGGQKSSRKISQGVNNWNFQYDAAEQRPEKATYFPVTAAQAANLEVGLYVSVGYGSNNNGEVNKDRGVNTMHSYADDVQILRIEDLDSGNKAVYLDISEGFTTTPVALTDALNAPITMSSMHIYTGETKKVIGKHDGAAVSNTSAKHPYRIQGVEYQVGAYQVVANTVMIFKSDYSKDVYIREKGTAWSSSESVIKSTYKFVGNIPASADGKGSDWWVGDVGVDEETGAWWPTVATDSADRGMGSRIYAGSTATSGLRESLEAGNLRGGAYSGSAFVNCRGGLGDGWWYFGSCD